MSVTAWCPDGMQRRFDSAKQMNPRCPACWGDLDQHEIVPDAGHASSPWSMQMPSDTTAGQGETCDIDNGGPGTECPLPTGHAGGHA